MTRATLEKIIGAASELITELLIEVLKVEEVNEDDDGGNRNNGQADPGEKFT